MTDETRRTWEHPAAIPVDELRRLAALAHLDLDALLAAAFLPP